MGRERTKNFNPPRTLLVLVCYSAYSAQMLKEELNSEVSCIKPTAEVCGVCIVWLET